MDATTSVELEQLSDGQLSAIFAAEVAGEDVQVGDYYHDHPVLGRCITGGTGPGVLSEDNGTGGGFYRVKPYSTIADLALPWLEKTGVTATFLMEEEREPRKWRIKSLVFGAEGVAPTFARAACIALIKAHRAQKEKP